jgi:hypothetical protein
MVATAAQIAANRLNAHRSTGPRSAEGKAASSRNALSHGAYADDDTILATTSDTYLEDFRARFQPADALEAHLVEHLAVLASRRKRLQLAMDALLELDERHALTEHLHERYGINTPNARIPGQPSWQAAMRRYDGNTYVDSRFPEPVSDPALDPDPILCSLAYTLSGPRAAALFRHEAAVDRRFSATLKELTTLQAQRRAASASAATTPPTTPRYEPSLQRALDRYLRETATPANPPRDPVPAPARTRPTAPAPAPSSLYADLLRDQTQSAASAHQSSAEKTQNEPTATVTPPGGIAVASDPSARLNPTHPATLTPAPDPRATDADQTQSAPLAPERTAQNAQNEAAAPNAMWLNQPNEAATVYDLPEDDAGGFLSVLPRYPDQLSSIPAHR